MSPPVAYTITNTRVVAVDWSGAVVGAQHRIWLAEAQDDQRLARLISGYSREELGTCLLEQAARTRRMVIGLDFAFGFPAWFSQSVLHASTGPQVWAEAAQRAETWLRACEPPFWGRPGCRRPPETSGPRFRRTEHAVTPVAGIRPKSIFQVGGAGSVGTGSLRGMPLLKRLHEAGACIWPFGSGGWPLVVEIYPRLLTDAVVKSSPAARERHLEAYPHLAPEHRQAAVGSEDAFDAAVSALMMARHLADLEALPPEPDPRVQLEGRIWHPAWRALQLC
jgi:Protein of unknown function (DUF429)